MGSLGNQTFQGMPNLHPEVRRRLDDLVRAINGNASQLTALSQNALTAAQAKDLIKQALASRSLLPLNITNATGTAGTPQPALIPIVKALPKSNSGLTFGQAVQYQNDIWIWNGTAWVLAVTSLYSDTHANRIATFPAANYVTGTLFYETDRKVLYVNISGIWDFCSGTMIDTAANRPADLGATDRNFLFLASDSLVNSYWNGAAWTTISAPPPTTLTLALRSVGTTPDSITAADFAIFNYVLGAAVENLPQASTVPEKIFAIAANSGGATVTVTAYAGDTIDGSGSTLVLAPGGIVWLQSDTVSNWVILGRYNAPVALAAAASTLSLTTGYQDVPGATLTLPNAGTYLIQASACIDDYALDGGISVQLLAAGAPQTPIIRADTTATFVETTGAQTWLYTANAGDVVKLQAKMDTAGGGGSAINAIGTSITATLVGGGGGGAAGGGGSFPLTLAQDFATNNGGSSVTSLTVTFPQATAASGNTAFMLVAADGSQAITYPAGWTVDIDQSQSLYSRFVLLHKATASDTSATFSWATGAAIAVYFFEVVGAHALDQSSLSGQANAQYVQLPAITPAVGSVVFGLIASTQNGNTGVPLLTETMSANWRSFCVSSFQANGGRFLAGFIATIPSVNVPTRPPVVSMPNMPLYAGGGIAYATFSIL